jgi:arylsulfatase A-like enzyme
LLTRVDLSGGSARVWRAPATRRRRVRANAPLGLHPRIDLEPPNRNADNETPRAVLLAAGIFAGFGFLAAADACAIPLTLPLPAAGLPLRLAHHVFDAAETLGVGAVAALAAGGFVQRVPLPRWAMWWATVAITIGIAYVTVGDFLARVAAQAYGDRFEPALYAGYLALIGVCFADAVRISVLLSRRRLLRFLPLAVAAGALIADQVSFPDDYAGIHGIVAWGAAMVGGAALAPGTARAARALMQSRPGRLALAAIALFALFGVVWPPPDAARCELFRQRCAVAPWILAATVWRPPGLHRPAAPSPSPWDEDRSRSPPIPPTTPPLLPPDAVVVLITIDAVRGDAVNDPANDPLFPTLTELKRDGVVFTHASAPGTQTPLSLGTLFSGLYFSELRWTNHGGGSTRYLYPADDPAPRFPALLSEHGVRTSSYGGLVFLDGEFGVIRGFQEESVVVEGRTHAKAAQLIDPLLARLEHAGTGPLFLYTHLMDPHWPYDRGRRDGTDYERYLSEIAVADAAVGRVLRRLESGFGKRWALIVSADHGEAFGDHQTTDHSKTLYEELLHVPLLARSPLFRPRTIDERVGLVDLGPTILDLFGVETPATFNGQSLVPLLAGGTRVFTRPLLAEGRLRRALTQPDGFKVIDDPRRKVVEAYDLAVDPGETRNVFDAEPARSDAALSALRAFFAVHTLRAKGYEPPYKN